MWTWTNYEQLSSERRTRPPLESFEIPRRELPREAFILRADEVTWNNVAY